MLPGVERAGLRGFVVGAEVCADVGVDFGCAVVPEGFFLEVCWGGFGAEPEIEDAGVVGFCCGGGHGFY